MMAVASRNFEPQAFAVTEKAYCKAAGTVGATIAAVASSQVIKASTGRTNQGIVIEGRGPGGIRYMAEPFLGRVEVRSCRLAFVGAGY